MTAPVKPGAERRPQAVRPARIAPLPNLPLFHKLDGRRVVVAGGGPAAVWKSELLAAAGADVRVLAGTAAAAASFAELAGDPPAGEVGVLPRPWLENDLDGAALAFGDFG
ncbi:MAG: NAD(P)-dependent oxidoreductase, partial [Allosphingosinicella sp.]